MQWKQIDKKKKQRTEALNTKVISEALEVRRRSDVFQKNVDTFSDQFQAIAPFNVEGSELKLELVRTSPQQCCRYSRNIAWVTPKIVYFQLPKNKS